MKITRWLGGVWLLVVMCLLAGAMPRVQGQAETTTTTAPAQQVQLTLVHINDAHGQLLGRTENGKAYGGYARLATYVDAVQKAGTAVRVGPGAMCIRGWRRKAIRMPAEKRRPVASLKPARQVRRVPMDAVVTRGVRAGAAIVLRLGKVDRMVPMGATEHRAPQASRGRPVMWNTAVNKRPIR